MTTNHTPGPWAIRDDDEDGVVSIVGSSQIVLARVRTATVEPGDGNASLIAAAPDLLEACQAADWNNLDLPEFVREKLSAAISKATGA